jgi:hypothetical protein
MQTSAIAKISASTRGWATAPPPPTTALSSSTAAVPQPAPGLPSHGPAAARTTTSSLTQIQIFSISDASALAVSYSTTVSGKSYTGSVVETGDTYVASVPNPPGSSASGSSVQAAENNLNIILDTLA